MLLGTANKRLCSLLGSTSEPGSVPGSTDEQSSKSGYTDERCSKSGHTPPVRLRGLTRPAMTSLYRRGAAGFEPSGRSLLVPSSEGGRLRDESTVSWVFGLVGKEFARARAFFQRLYLVDIFIYI